jgi:hypothetical protein
MDERSSAQVAIAEDGAGRPRRGLSPRAERVACAVIEAILADEDTAGNLIPGSRAACDRAVRWLTLATGQASGDVRRGYGFLTLCVQWLPLFVIGLPRRMTSLSLADRVRYLSALEASRIGLLAMLVMAFKVPMGIPAFEDGDELRATGFDRPDTASRRSLPFAPSAMAMFTRVHAGAHTSERGRAHECT